MNWAGLTSSFFYQQGWLLDPYGSWNPTVTSPDQSPSEPLTLAQAKAFLRIIDGPTTDTAQDNEISRMISAARRTAEFAQCRELVRRQWDLSYDYWPGQKIGLRKPLISVDLVQYKDNNGNIFTLTENTDYIVDKAKPVPIILPTYNSFWPAFTRWPSSAILIRCTCGHLPSESYWSNEGAHVLQGIQYLVQHFYDNREAFTRGIGNIEEFPYAVTALLGLGSHVIVG
jgi:uncharacterized phiE125 gp8 family phage protein